MQVPSAKRAFKPEENSCNYSCEHPRSPVLLGMLPHVLLQNSRCCSVAVAALHWSQQLLCVRVVWEQSIVSLAMGA